MSLQISLRNISATVGRSIPAHLKTQTAPSPELLPQLHLGRHLAEGSAPPQSPPLPALTPTRTASAVRPPNTPGGRRLEIRSNTAHTPSE